MAHSRSALAGTAPAAGGHAAQAQSAVLIAEREVLFGTAAAARVRWDVGPADRPPRPRRKYSPRRYGFLDWALMAREMGKL
jgi:hypothetical protein